jgi:glycogen(starch) synthase
MADGRLRPDEAIDPEDQEPVTLRILVVTNMYPPHHYGGYELSCRDTVERWRAKGHDVTVLTTTLRVPGVADPPDEPNVRRELGFYWDDHVMLDPPFARRVAIERTDQAALNRAIEEVRPDVVSVWHMSAMSLGMLTTIRDHGLPIVLVVCDDWLVYGIRTDPWMRRARSRRSISHFLGPLLGLPTSLPDGGLTACFNSDWIKQRADKDSFLHYERATVVYSGIDTRDFGPPQTLDREWSWRLACVGRIEERKGVHVAVEALRHLAHATLEIVGRGDERYLRHLHELVAKFGLEGRVRFAEVPRDALRTYYVDADACIFPVTWDEPFGLVPVEAMACGTPVVGTATGGSAEFLIDGANCLRVPPGDDAAIAAAVDRLASYPSLRRRLIEGGLATAKILDADTLANTLEAWHEAAAAGFAHGEPPHLPTPRMRLASVGIVG